MRTCYLLPFILLLAGGCSSTSSLPAMQPQAEPMKGANRIIVNVDDDGYRRAGQALTQLGYAIGHSDSELQTITTQFREVNGGQIQIIATVQDNTVSLRGQGGLNVNVGQAMLGSWMKEDSADRVELIGQKGSPARNWWEALDAVAHAIGGDVLYARDRP